MKVEFMFGLGDVLLDKVSGFKGTVTSVTMYLNGCKQYCLKAKLSKVQITKGEFPEGQFFDEEQLEPAGGKVKTTRSNTGGQKTDTPSSTCHR